MKVEWYQHTQSCNFSSLFSFFHFILFFISFYFFSISFSLYLGSYEAVNMVCYHAPCNKMLILKSKSNLQDSFISILSYLDITIL